MIAVNLIPEEYIEQEKQKTLIKMAGGAGGVVVLLLAIFSFLLFSRNQALAKQKMELEDRARQLQTVADEVDRMEALKRSIALKISTIERLFQGRFDYPAFMEAFAESLPPSQVSIKSLNMQKNGKNFTLAISAEGMDTNGIIQWLRRLEERPAFSDIQLGPISYGSDRVNFSINLKYALP